HEGLLLRPARAGLRRRRLLHPDQDQLQRGISRYSLDIVYDQISYTKINLLLEEWLMAGAKLDWTGVIPAATTQFDEGLAVDLDATQTVLDGLINDGVDGIIVMGTVGENNSLEPEEKRAVLKAAVEVADGRVPIITGVSELTTARAERYAKDAEDLGVDALMVLPAMVYVPTQAELEAHLRAVAAASGVPKMLYNNPLMYRQTLNNDDLKRLSDVPNIVAQKESAPDSRRITDIFNELGDRYALMVGLDDVALEGLILGAKGWVSG